MRIQFVSETPLEVEHYAPVVLEARRQGIATDIVPVHPSDPDPDVQANHDADHRASVALLEARRIPFAREMDPRADVAIVTSIASMLDPYERAVRLKFRYGMSTIRQNVHYSEGALTGFDGLLVHGDMDERIFAPHFDRDRIAQMGFPLYDDFFRHPPDAEQLRARYGLTAKRPIIAYLPSWNWEGHSSILPFREALAVLAREHGFVVKPHPNTELYVEERPAFEALQGLAPDVLLPATTPLAHAMAVADLLITDAKSGTTSEVPLAYPGKPVVMLTPFDEDAFWPAIRMIGPLVSDPEWLVGAVGELLEDDGFEASRRAYAQEAFGVRRGDAAAQAVRAILHLHDLSRRPAVWGRLLRRLRGHGRRRREPPDA